MAIFEKKYKKRSTWHKSSAVLKRVYSLMLCLFPASWSVCVGRCYLSPTQGLSLTLQSQALPSAYTSYAGRAWIEILTFSVLIK